MAANFDLQFFTQETDEMESNDKENQQENLEITKRRFADVTEIEKQRIINDIHSNNTKKSTDKSTKIFREWLSERHGYSDDFRDLSKESLDNYLASFWMEVRTTTGEYYKKSSLQNIRHGLMRSLQASEKHKQLDLVRDPAFQKSNKSFKGMLKELKRIGKGDVKHHEPLTEDDMTKCYSYLSGYASDNTILQEKVFFDLMLHLIRRGRENIRQLTVQHFKVLTDSQGRRYITQVLDEATKNHPDDDSSPKGRVYEAKGAAACPVTSFVLYLSKLSPESNVLFQQPMKPDSYSRDACWYQPVPIGHNTIGQMMPRISTKASLSQNYTNHCLRSTSITVLDDAQFESRHIMAVSGHRSESSIKSYSHHTSERIQHQMSETLNRSVGLVSAKSSDSDPTQDASPNAGQAGKVQQMPSRSNQATSSGQPETLVLHQQSQQIATTTSFDLMDNDVSDALLSQVVMPTISYAKQNAPHISHSVVHIHYH